MNNQFQPLDSDEVISSHNFQAFGLSGTFTPDELFRLLGQKLQGNMSTDAKMLFNKQGMAGKVLQFGSNGWRKGRIRFAFEFCPDEPEVAAQPEAEEQAEQEVSPLDEIRRMTIDDELSNTQ